MNTIHIVALYAGLNAIILLWLSIRVGIHRTRTKAVEPGSTGQGDALLIRAVRAHGNFIEYAPAVLFLLYLLANLGYSPMVMHIFGAVFTVGRVFHGIGMMQDKQPNPLRMIGTMAAMLPLLVGGIACIVAYF